MHVNNPLAPSCRHMHLTNNRHINNPFLQKVNILRLVNPDFREMGINDPNILINNRV